MNETLLIISYKHTLATSALAFDLLGAFLLAIPMLFGIDTVILHVLRIRSQLRRLTRRYAQLPKQLRKYPDGISIGTSPKPDELSLNFSVFLSGLITLSTVAIFNVNSLISIATTPLEWSNQLDGATKYALATLILIALVFCAVVAIAIFLAAYWFTATLIIAITALLLIGALSLPVRFLYWISRGAERNREQKIGRIGFVCLLIAFFIQFAINIAPEVSP